MKYIWPSDNIFYNRDLTAWVLGCLIIEEVDTSNNFRRRGERIESIKYDRKEMPK